MPKIDFSDLQIVYTVLVLPSLFGLTLLAEGLNKLKKGYGNGWLSTVVGAMFILLVVFVYFFLL